MMRRGFVSPFALLLALFLSACTSQPQLPALPSDATILAFGDSLTYGSGAKRDESYPVVLSRLTGLEVINAGVPGEVTSAGVKRLPALLDEIQPQLLILCHGGNDMLRKLGMLAAANNLRAMIRLAQQRDVPVILVAVPQPGLMLSPPDFYEAVADEMKVPIENDVLADVLADRSLKSDMIHPNAQGYQKVAEAVATLLRETGALN